jgi:hypothetical protein
MISAQSREYPSRHTGTKREKSLNRAPAEGAGKREKSATDVFFGVFH